MKIKFFNKNDVIRRKSGNATVEGGLSRNGAWEELLKKNPDCTQVMLSYGNKKNTLIVFRELLFAKDHILFFLYPTIGVPILGESPSKKKMRDTFFNLVNSAAKRNKVVFDISDLKYEQAIDLKLKTDHMPLLEQAEKEFFSLDAYYIFASHEMRSYACEKYKIDESRTDVCVNGGTGVTKGITSDFTPAHDAINFVYAGTLNRGRGIEEMIDTFPDDARFRLILMGMDGEWIAEHKSRSNICYLGPKPEPEAAYISSMCDVGLIPYDESLLYYNIAYPTKLSFYITAGIPYLSTPVKEVKRADKDGMLGWTETLSGWGRLISGMSEDEIKAKKLNVSSAKAQYFWKETLKNRFVELGE